MIELRKVDFQLYGRGPCKAEVFVTDEYGRELPEGQYRATFRMTEPPFGCKDTRRYEHALTGDRERILHHWEGFCFAYGYGLFIGRTVAYYSSGAVRRVRIMHQPKAGAKTILVTGFRYKTYDGKSEPRRISHWDWCGPQKPETSKSYQAAQAADAVAWFCHGVAGMAGEASCAR